MKQAEDAANQFLARNIKPGMGNHSLATIQQAVKIALEIQRVEYEKKIMTIYSDYNTLGVKEGWSQRRKKKKLLKEMESVQPIYRQPQFQEPIQPPTIYSEPVEQPKPTIYSEPVEQPQPLFGTVRQGYNPSAPIHKQPIKKAAPQPVSQEVLNQNTQQPPQPPLKREPYIHPDLGTPPPPLVEKSEGAAVYPVRDSGIHEAEYPHEYGRGEVEPDPQNIEPVDDTPTVRSDRGRR